jgi:D-glycero-alpha-D-manno-heptose 1-phosphate guanylyltransferase
MSQGVVNIRKKTTTAIVLAGGLGTRVRHLLAGVPKPMHEVNDQPFLLWLIKYFISEGVTQFLISAGYRGEVIQRYFERDLRLDANIRVIRELEPLGTAGGLLHAVDKHTQQSVPDYWLIINGDSFTPIKYDEIAAELEDPGIDGVMIGIRVDNSDGFGKIELDKKKLILSFAEKIGGPGVINAGIYCFKNYVFEGVNRCVPQSIERDLIPHLLRTGIRIKVIEVGGPFLDIGTPQNLNLAEDFVRTFMSTRVNHDFS